MTASPRPRAALRSMGPSAGVRALVRAAYRLVRFPFHLVDDVVLPVIFDEDAPVRRAYGKFLLDCDGSNVHAAVARKGGSLNFTVRVFRIRSIRRRHPVVHVNRRLLRFRPGPSRNLSRGTAHHGTAESNGRLG